MRILIIADDKHLSIAVKAAQIVIGEEPGSSITITSPEESIDLIDRDGYDYVIKNPVLEDVLRLIKKGHKLC